MKRLLICLAVVGCNEKPAVDPHALDQAWLKIGKMAFEGFPMWAAKHPAKSCPDTIADLVAESEVPDSKDPWGHEMKMFCGSNLPAGAKGLAVVSAGPDGKFDTADDIKSWGPRPTKD